ncbi:MAG: monovalent cation:proton antiporter-2 (CPA2) family protein [Sphingorhabdus sp.]
MNDGAEYAVADMLASGAVLLGAAMVSVLIFRRLGLGAVLGYLIAGILVGPFGFAMVEDPETILSFSEIGIVLLLFLVGLELSPRRLWQMRQDIFVLGPLQVVSCGLAMFAIVLAMQGFTWQAALVIGLPLGLSSTAQVLPLLQSHGRLKTDYGGKSFSILLFQDLSIVPLLTIVAALSRVPPVKGSASGAMLVLYAILAIVALVLAGRYILNPLLKLIGKVSERELFIVAGLFTVCASAALMQWLGLSAALGAFVAGVMLAESPYRHELEADIDPFRSILLGFFFLAVGMLLDLNVIAAQPWAILLMAIMLVGVKTGLVFGLGRLFGLKASSAIIMALLLSQGGEFGFVLFAAAERAMLVEKEAASFFGAVVTLSMASTPFLMMLAARLARRAQDKEIELTDPEYAEQASVIIVGHGRFGQTVAQIMQGAGRSVTIIDIKPDQIDMSQEFGRKVFYGDGTRIDLLRRAGADEACAILFCIDDRQLDAETLEPVRASFPDAKVFARAYDRRQMLELMSDAKLGVYREVIESSINMAHGALVSLGVPDRAAKKVIGEFRKRDQTRLKAQFESGNMRAGSRHSFGGSSSDDFTMDEN